MMKRLFMLGLAVTLLGASSEARAASGVTAAATITTTSSAVLAADDLSNPRAYIKLCNVGSGLAYYCFGAGATSCTATLGFPLAPLSCDTYKSEVRAAGVWANPPNADISAIADTVTPRTTITVVDY